MTLVLQTDEYPEFLKKIKHILDKNPKEINKTNELGWTPLMLACINSNTVSTIETVELLLSFDNINVNSQNKEFLFLKEAANHHDQPPAVSNAFWKISLPPQT